MGFDLLLQQVDLLVQDAQDRDLRPDGDCVRPSHHRRLTQLLGG